MNRSTFGLLLTFAMGIAAMFFYQGMGNYAHAEKCALITCLPLLLAMFTYDDRQSVCTITGVTCE